MCSSDLFGLSPTALSTRSASIFLPLFRCKTALDSDLGSILAILSCRAHCTPRSASAVLHLNSGKQIEADLVLSAVGLKPNVSLAEQAGLEVGRGIKVNQFGQTSDEFFFMKRIYVTPASLFLMSFFCLRRASLAL